MTKRFGIVCTAASLGFLLVTSFPVAGQDGPSGPVIVPQVKHDISPPLDHIRSNRAVGPPRQRPLRLTHKPEHFPATSDEAVQSSTGPRVVTTSGSNITGIGANGFAPSDSNAAVGATQVVEWVNV